MNQPNLFCISDEELAADRAALSPDDRAAVDALPSSFEDSPAPPAPPHLYDLAAPAPKHDARLDAYTGPFPRKRHYHRCPQCRAKGSGGVHCYKSRCMAPVLMSTPCQWCRTSVAPGRTTDAGRWRAAAYGD
jgi:hypothetical protein